MNGLLYFYESKDEQRKIIVQVKGGDVKRGEMATLLGDVNNQKAAGGILLTLEKPTKSMRDEPADSGRYESKRWHDKDYLKVQILTIEGFLNNTERMDTPAADEPFGPSPAEVSHEGKTWVKPEWHLVKAQQERGDFQPSLGPRCCNLMCCLVGGVTVRVRAHRPCFGGLVPGMSAFR